MAYNKTSLAQAMSGNGGFVAGVPRGKGKGHKYDLSGTTSGPGFKEPDDTEPDPTASTDEESGEQDAGGGEFKRLTITPSDNGGFLIECEYNDDGSGNMEPPSTHTFEDAQSALAFVDQKMTGEDQGGEGDGSDEADDSSGADGTQDDSLG